jgi:hypothetical protein
MIEHFIIVLSLLHFEGFKTIQELELELFNLSLMSRGKGVIIEKQEEK